MPPVASEQTKQRALEILREVATKYPRAYANAHRDENQHPEAWDFIILGTRELNRFDSLFGMNGKRGNLNDPSSDVFAYGTGTDVLAIDCIRAAGSHGNNLDAIQWFDVTGVGGAGAIWINPFSRTTHVDYSGGGTQPLIRLGASLFPLIGMFKKFRSQLDRNLQYLANNKIKYIRSMGVLGGGFISGHDPWSLIGYDVNASDYVQLVKDSTKHVFEQFGLRVFWTIIGSREQIQSVSEVERVVRIFANISQEQIEGYEEANEYGLFNKATIAEMRGMSNLLRSLVGNNQIISLSSPNSLHVPGFSNDQVRAEVREMYEGLSSANAITPHWDRSIGAHRVPGFDLGPFEPQFVINNEWFGPGSSGRSVENAGEMANALKLSIQAGESHFVLHCEGGIYMGHVDPFFNNPPRTANIFDHSTMDEILRAFSIVSIGGEYQGGGGGGVPSKPYPGDQFFWHSVGDVLEADYHEAGQLLNAGSSVWFARTIWDHVNEGLTMDQSIAKHRAEWRHALGLPT